MTAMDTVLVERRSVNRYFLGTTPLEWSVVAILTITAILKAAAVLQPDRIISMENPILPVSNRVVLACVAAIEIAIALHTLRSRNEANKQILLVWLISCFVVYRVGWWLVGTGPCLCLGTGFRWWPWLHENLSSVSLGLLALLVLLVAINFVDRVYLPYRRLKQ